MKILVQAIVLGGLFVILTAGFWINLETISSIPLCLFKYVTGLDCPGCGLTRSFVCLSSGQLMHAFRFNASGPFLYVAFCLYFIDRALQMMTSSRRLHVPLLFTQVLSVMIVFTMFGHWVVKLITETNLIHLFHI